MKTVPKIGIILISLVIPLSLVDGADLANQVEGTNKAGKRWTAKTIPMDKQRVEMQFDVTGVVFKPSDNSQLLESNQLKSVDTDSVNIISPPAADTQI